MNSITIVAPVLFLQDVWLGRNHYGRIRADENNGRGD